MRRWPPAFLLALSACVSGPQIAYNPRADFAMVRRVAVLTFDGPQGDAAAELMTQNLVFYGADVVERRRLEAVLNEQRLSQKGILDPRTTKRMGKILGVDALFIGTVVQSLPEQSYIVSTAERNRRTQVTPISRPYLSAGLPVPGVPESQIITAAANVSLVSRMVDVETGSILWAGSMNYDALDTGTAMRTITSGFVDSLVPIWPGLRRPK